MAVGVVNLSALLNDFFVFFGTPAGCRCLHPSHYVKSVLVPFTLLQKKKVPCNIIRENASVFTGALIKVF